jgi:hypothetical protein
LTGTIIVDDTSSAHQRTPSIVVANPVVGDPAVFVCWQDERNLTAGGLDTDLYTMEIKPGSETNVFVGDGGTGTNQSEPALGADVHGRPYVVWTDHRNFTDEIYYAPSTFVEPAPLESQFVNADTGGTVGSSWPSTVDDVSIAVPAGACPYDVTISVSRIRNLQPHPTASILPYEFGPSGLPFDAPVTITIPYAATEFQGELPVPYWHDPLTDTLSQEGITNVAYVTVTPDVHALQFDAVHFTPYLLFADVEGGTGGGGGTDGGSGGGCSLSSKAEADPYGYFAPYAILALVMLAIRRRDAMRRLLRFRQ